MREQFLQMGWWWFFGLFINYGNLYNHEKGEGFLTSNVCNLYLTRGAPIQANFNHGNSGSIRNQPIDRLIVALPPTFFVSIRG